MKKLILLFVLAFAGVQAHAAVTSSFQRIGHSDGKPTAFELVTATLGGTYATGGFTWNIGAIAGTPGSSPLPQRSYRQINWFSPNGYIYVTTISGSTATTKIFSAPGTELANGTAVPDASVNLIVYLSL